MEDILIVPDVHGRKFWRPALKFKGEVIFLGDYVDPYEYEGISEEMALEEFREIVKFKQANKDRVTLLIGNHEMHYYNAQYGAGRKSWDLEPQIKELLEGEETKDLFQVCRQIGKYLFIHAGITADWYKRHYDEFKDLGSTLEEQMNQLFKKRMFTFHEAGMKYRGGIDDTGSPMWADYHEFGDEEEPFAPDIIQIIGHTQQKGNEPIFLKNIRMLDVRRLFLLHNDEITPYSKKK